MPTLKNFYCKYVTYNLENNNHNNKLYDVDLIQLSEM